MTKLYSFEALKAKILICHGQKISTLLTYIDAIFIAKKFLIHPIKMRIDFIFL